MAGEYYDDNKAAYDSAAKRFLSKKRILAYILKGVVPEFKDVSIDDIETHYIESEPLVGTVPTEPDYTPNIIGNRNEDNSPTEGLITFDILFHATAPTSGEPIELIINIEAQKDNPSEYQLLRRAEFYACRLISAQKNTEFTHSNYNKLKKVYTIWIAMTSPDKKSHANAYKMSETPIIGNYRANPADYQLVNIALVFLGNYPTRNKMLELLRLIFKSEIAAAEKRKRLAQNYNIELIPADETELIKMCNLGEGIYEEGLKKGELKGEKKGEKRGFQNGIIQGYRDMLAMGLITIDQLKLTGKLTNAQLALLAR